MSGWQHLFAWRSASRSRRAGSAGSALGLLGLVLACSAGPEATPDPFVGGGAGGTPGAGGSGNAGASNAGAAGAASGGSGQGGSGQGGSGQSGSGQGGSGLGGSGGSQPTAGAGGQVAGASGAGGVAGSAGTAGAAGSAGTGGAPPAGADCAAEDLLCDDFESATAGLFPSGPWDANACTSHVVDAAVAHAGAQSLRGGAEQYPACMAHANLDGESELYARSWIRLGAASSESGHEIGFLELGPTLADNPEVRVGVRNNDSVCAQAPGVEVTVDGIDGGERTSCSGVALEADRWYCLEVHFARAAGSVSFGVSIDGSVVVPETTHGGAVAAWSEGPLFLKLGRSSYGGNNVFPVWHDDVIVSNTPIGCAE